jgi:hypothetical protein
MDGMGLAHGGAGIAAAGAAPPRGSGAAAAGTGRIVAAPELPRASEAAGGEPGLRDAGGALMLPEGSRWQGAAGRALCGA